MNPLSSLHFKYNWRAYQQRFLDDFPLHLEDGHLHLVAPPGSGKTVLGLEMVRRINKKTLILAPTLTIRNQWNERMQQCFVKGENSISISFDIKNPATITFSTYQSLHSFFKKDLDGSHEKIENHFKKSGIECIVLDEAHHLKNEWWKPLFALKKLPDCILISLTATPPYDSDLSEIANYFQLCGPIDMEISLPELVKAENLCPHQDYIYFSEPEQEQIRYIIKYREQLVSFVSNLKSNMQFQDFILRHPYYRNTEDSLEEIYENPSLYSAILIFLNSIDFVIPSEKIEILGVKSKNISFPSLNYEWVEALLQPILIVNRTEFIEDEALLDTIEKDLRKIGAFENKRINLVGENRLYRTLSQSPTKLKSIAEIVKVEASNLKENLRMVILTDYIRKEFLDFKYGDSISEINKLGVVPIFQFLRHTIKRDSELSFQKSKLAVLTGSLIIIHNSIVQKLKDKFLSDAFSQEILWDSEYVLIKPTESGKMEMVGAITQLFEQGNIEVLIGTKSLLGEGWDAPAINTLIMASFVGSFVTSNQMRGRAIRINPKNPEKIANIWHIACIDKTSEMGGADIEMLIRRFNAFCGISLEGDLFIENGIDRLEIVPKLPKIEELNEKMVSLAKNRKQSKVRWNAAIGNGKVLIRELKLNFNRESKAKKTRKFYYRDLVKYSSIELFSLLLLSLPQLVINNIVTLFSKGLVYFFYAIMSGIFVLFLPKTISALKLYLKYGRRHKQLYKFAQSLKGAMLEKGIIKTPSCELNIIIEESNDGGIACFLTGASVKESLLFVDYLEEILAPIENPRYLITKSGWLRKKVGVSNYYSVPKVFGERKTDAEIFFGHWQKFHSNSHLSFTRNKEGRKLLLKARFHYFQTEEKLISKKGLIWK
ncbi:DEAD/DEAH box helicase family protein [Aequorivita echinoideorum]|uniref:DEAD/DEAH box helicase family protein n=1 Tax=Aequorivita echinoideorum TaxID=1549647 RepID=A0ABS5S622_9FLAO|nr:DEAD/DEAH box helicase family protein [Aequorivita echinoideorum]MBT0607875.1 DEAD/DEAH box helicase family protein [Aequorivita echinoideorum]